MTQTRPRETRVPTLLNRKQLALAAAGDGDAGIFKLKQHVDNPGQ